MKASLFSQQASEKAVHDKVPTSRAGKLQWDPDCLPPQLSQPNLFPVLAEDLTEFAILIFELLAYGGLYLRPHIIDGRWIVEMAECVLRKAGELDEMQEVEGSCGL
jgi:hypothetical protein